jgi:peptidoglycan/xylan/chitin deacetylase (PgdA/CDA1 family)
VTPEEFLDRIVEPRRSELVQLDTLIRAAVPQLDRVVHGGMLGYGPYHYRYPSGREGDTCVIALANQKSYISLYVNAVDAEQYLPETYADLFPKANIGRACIRVKRAADLDPASLTELLRKAATSPAGKA